MYDFVRQKNVLFVVMFLFLSIKLWSHNFCPPKSTEELIEFIKIANANNEDDVIDLAGQTFILDQVQEEDCNTCLPSITGDDTLGKSHSLTIKNGTLERSQLIPLLRCRHFYIKETGMLHLENMRLRYGLLDYYDAEPGNLGGSIYNDGALSVNVVTFDHNSANNGGAIYNNKFASIGNSTFYANNAKENGGAIYNNDTIDQLFNSTFFNNYAGNDGGAIYNIGVINGFSNNTIAANEAAEQGGGIWNSESLVLKGQIVNFISNIVAVNKAFAGLDIYDTSPSPGIEFAEYNLISVSDNHSIINGVDHNMVGTLENPLIPLLGPLQDNGGRIWTMALLTGSPAINAGSNPLGLDFDERGPGYLRERGNTDIGAFEVQICLDIGDTDEDGVCCDVDNCLNKYNPDQSDIDENGIGDACDVCPEPIECEETAICDNPQICDPDLGCSDCHVHEIPVYIPKPVPVPEPVPVVPVAPPIPVPPALIDGQVLPPVPPLVDPIVGPIDSPVLDPIIAEAPQSDKDEEEEPFEIIVDSDRDGLFDYEDNCPNVSNKDQQDLNGNRIGDACEDFANFNDLNYAPNHPMIIDEGGGGCSQTGAESQVATNMLLLFLLLFIRGINRRVVSR